jgi:hypothetical protein
MLASRAAAERLATRRVESMMAMKNGKEERARPSSKNWDGRGKGKDRENKRSEMLRLFWALTHVSGTRYLVMYVTPHT